jgi:hypothetical protein
MFRDWMVNFAYMWRWLIHGIKLAIARSNSWEIAALSKKICIIGTLGTRWLGHNHC